jgi:hypothetical protein
MNLRKAYIESRPLALKFSLLATLFLLVSCATPTTVTSPYYNPEKYSRVAVIAIPEQPDINPGLLRRIEDSCNMEIMKKGYSVVSRSDIARVMNEMNFQRMSLVDQSTKVTQIGKILKVPGIVIASVNNVREIEHVLPESYSSGTYVNNGSARSHSSYSGAQVTTISSAAVSARLVDVSTTDVLWIGQASLGGAENPFSALSSMVGDGSGGAENLAHILAMKVASTYPDRFPKTKK